MSNAVGFSASASGTAPLFYQWWFDGAPITGATGTTFTILRTATNQAGLYRVTVSNYAGLRSSTNALPPSHEASRKGPVPTGARPSASASKSPTSAERGTMASEVANWRNP